MPNPSALRVVFAGGGTGGHLYPAIAIADALRERGDVCVTFVGTAGRLEATIVPNAGYPLRTVEAGPLSRSPLHTAGSVAANARGIARSVGLLRELAPDLVIATGGYVAFPVVVAARMLRAAGRSHAPIALLEPNAEPGKTNRALAPLVDEVWGAFEPGERRWKATYLRTGVPVRAGFRTLPRPEDARRRFGLDPHRPTLLALGGSQGARSINDALIAAVSRATAWQALVVAGERDFARVRAALPPETAVVPFLDEMASGYAAADLVLSRAGASTLAELAAVGKPAILVPYPYAAADHQTRNARAFARDGGAVVVADADLAGSLPGLLRDALDPEWRASRARPVSPGDDPLATILARVEALTSRREAR